MPDLLTFEMTTALLAATTLVVVFAVTRGWWAMRALYPEPLPFTPIEGDAAPVHIPGRPTAVVLLDHGGTEVSDFLLPYELLAASEAFNVLAVAPELRPVTLTAGLDVMPHMSHADFDRYPSGRADVVVVPHMPDPDPQTISWLRRQASMGATVLSICTGAGIAASAGLFDGRRATAHWGDVGRFERRYPDVAWLRGVRFVDDGDIAASAGITSGIDATLHVIRRIAGDDAMRRAARAVGYTDLGYLDDPTVEQHQIEASDLIVPWTAAFARRPTTGVLLRDGVHETSVAAAMDTYGANLVARMLTVSDGGRAVRSCHGLTFLPRGRAETVPTEHRFVPSADADAARIDRPAGIPLPRRGPPYLAFREALDHLANHHGRRIARFAAKRLEHRTTKQHEWTRK